VPGGYFKGGGGGQRDGGGMARAKKGYPEEMSVAERRRREIMQAACKLFSEKGYHSTRIDDIAKELNIARGLFYHYFRNKLDVYTQIIEELIIRITNGVLAETEKAPGDREEFIDQVRRLAERLLTVLTDDPYISRMLFLEVQGIDEEVARRLYFTFDLFGQYTQFYLEKGIERGFLRPGIDVAIIAPAINAMIIEGARYCAQAEDREEAKKRWVKATNELVLFGLLAPEK